MGRADKEKKKTSPEMSSKYRGRDKTDLVKGVSRAKGSVIVKSEAGLRVTRAGVASAEGADVSPLADLLSSEGVILEPLFDESEERLNHEVASLAPSTDAEVPDQSIYYRAQAPDERLDEIAERLREQECVEAAYVKPRGELPVAAEDEAEIFNEKL